MEGKTVYFDRPGEENTDEVLRVARQRADELGIKTMVVASTRGNTAVKAMEVFQGFRVIVVTHVMGFKETDVQDFIEENRKIVEGKGGILHTASHIFAYGGLSAAMRNKFGTATPGDIMAGALRIFGQGMKVVCEIVLMAADGGLVRTDEEVIAIAGTGKGADTAVVCNPVNTSRFFDLRIKEILCKPRF